MSSSRRSSDKPNIRLRMWSAVSVLAFSTNLASPARAQTAAPAIPATQEAGAALQRGDFDKAILLYNSALEDGSVSNDRRAVLLSERGVALMKRRNYKAALDDFNKAATIYPEYAAVYVNRGNLLLVLNQGPETTKEAIKDFDRAIVLSPGLAAAFGNRAAAQLKLGNLDLAVADFTRAIELQPLNPAALNGRGRARFLAGRTHAAVRDFTRAVTLNPGFAQSYRNCAEADMRLGIPLDAVEDISRALAFDARRVEDYNSRAQAYLATNNTAAALTDFDKVIELDPKSVEGHIGRGIAKARSDVIEDALADLSRAIELEPRSARAYAVRAWIYKKGQQPELGEKDVERALRLEPVTADAFWAQGELKEAVGDRDSAVAAYSRALGLDLRHRETLAALARLGLEPQRDETLIASAGLEGWRVTSGNGQFTATHPQFPALRVALEMMGQGQPRITGWERQRAPNSNFGLLQYTAGNLQTALGAEPVETTAVIDLASMAVVGMPVTKLGSKVAKLDWDNSRLVITGADGLAETITLRPSAEAREIAAAAVRKDEAGSPPRGQAASGVTQREAAARHAPQRKPKTLFDLIFGN